MYYYYNMYIGLVIVITGRDMSAIRELMKDKSLILEALLKNMMENNLNKNQTSDAIGISKMTLTSFLRGDRPTSFKTLFKIIKYLGMD